MTRELLVVIVAIVGLVTAAAGGVWTIAKMDARIAVLEDTEAWMEMVDERLDTNDQRWAKHFNLWGKEIREQERARGSAQ